MGGLCRNPVPGFDWLVEPVLNKDTRLAAVANAANDNLQVQGWETDGAATEIFDLSAAMEIRTEESVAR